MSPYLNRVSQPEIIIGLAGPIGVDLDHVEAQLTNELKSYDYVPVHIKLSDEMLQIDIGRTVDTGDYIKRYNDLISYANEVRLKTNTPEMLAVLGISAIRRERSNIRHQGTPESKQEATPPLIATAYIIRQLKRPEEVELLRRVYGRQFILISVYTAFEKQCEYLKTRAIQKGTGSYDEDALNESIAALVKRDLREAIDPRYGQNIVETFPKGDVFVNADSEAPLRRFLKLFFGFNGSSPSIDEYGMYLAKAASLRTLDLSRQVGAAILAESGELISLGCNEVPRAHGGIYDDQDEEGKRDWQLGYDPNEREKKRVLADLMRRLKALNALDEEQFGRFSIDDILNGVLSDGGDESLKNSRVMDIIEFGRIIHAEMHALTEAARFGRAVKGATLFCTTFPCHLCAKHIVAAGIERVVYIEPYPKSYARLLHSDSISIGEKSPDKVEFSPFLGISPYRYRELFETGRRKDSSGNFEEWKGNEKSPRLEIYIQAHDLVEDVVIRSFRERDAPPAERSGEGGAPSVSTEPVE